MAKKSKEVVVTARGELEEIAGILHQADIAEKEAKSLKDEVKGPFFELISEVVREEIALARKVVDVEVTEGFDPQTWRKYNWPLHNIVGIDYYQNDDEPQHATITLEESDQFKKFEFTVNGFKFGRTVRMDGKGFEADRFVESIDDFDIGDDLRKRLRDVVKEEVITTYSVNEAAMSKLMAEHPETVAIFQEFINPGTPKLALLPIKAAKEQEEE